MRHRGTKLIGVLVWRGGRWYLRRTYHRHAPSRRTSIALATALLLLVALALGLTSSRRAQD